MYSITEKYENGHAPNSISHNVAKANDEKIKFRIRIILKIGPER